jgi:23S rRNA (cytidine1920-2'-O)/16S rRNA (cytidine1409-2'-O)-methyltransferase
VIRTAMVHMGSRPRQRADNLLVQLGYFESRARAQAAILAGGVTANGATVRKASDMLDPAAKIIAEPAHPYVSRGGLKLAEALDHFEVNPHGLNCLDVGASTGGFTDVLMRRGAARITAVDVGTAQLHASLRGSNRILSLENQDIRSLSLEQAQGPFDLAVADVSFIPLSHVLAATLAMLKPEGMLICLIKPQFEVGRKHLRKGIVTDDAVREAACAAIVQTLVQLNCDVAPVHACSLRGGDGNQEYLICARRRAGS